MAYDSNGNFTRVRRWQDDAANNIDIEADLHDQEDDNLAGGFNQVLLRNGVAAMTGDLKMGLNQIKNLGLATQDGDAVSLGQVTGAGSNPALTFKNALNLSGVDAKGRINFTGASGVNGLSWTVANMSFVTQNARSGSTTTPPWGDHMSVTSAANAGGSEVAAFDRYGWLDLQGGLTYNLSTTNNVNWYKQADAFSAQLQLSGNTFQFKGNDVKPDNSHYNTPVSLRTFRQIYQSAGSVGDLITKTASGDVVFTQVRTGPQSAPETRWTWTWSDSTAETGNVANDYTGSNFVLQRYDNTGANPKTVLHIIRDTGEFRVGGPIAGVDPELTITGGSAAGTVTISPSNAANAVKGNIICSTTGGHNSSGGISFAQIELGVSANNQSNSVNATIVRAGIGIQCKLGDGAYQNDRFCFSFQGGVGTHLWIDGADQGVFSTCDYRWKRDIAPLGSVWDKVKALRPIRYKSIAEDDGDRERWGFVAHQLQEDLLETAAWGQKDAEFAIQSPNLMTVCAALASALQEAMVRIEALEGAA